jgi:hypothetical protein
MLTKVVFEEVSSYGFDREPTSSDLKRGFFVLLSHSLTMFRVERS